MSDKFSVIQRVIFNKRCLAACHSGDLGDLVPPKAELSLQADSAYNQLLYNHVLQNLVRYSQYPALVVPFHPDSSYLVFKLTLPENNDVDGDYMPNDNSGHLPEEQINAIISWIKRGAPND